MQQNAQEEAVQQSRSKAKEALKKEWACHDCGEGYLRIMLLPRMDGIFYIRRRSNKECGNRTNAKKYTSDVRGIKEDEDT